MKKIVFCILILWCALLVGSVSAEREIVIGAIIDESGDSASFAKGIEAAVNLAAADMNEYYAKTGKNITVIIKKAGTDGSKEAAAQAARDLINQGVQIIVGPTTSEEVFGYLPIITNEGILSISPSTSIKLSLPGCSCQVVSR
jgi:ABC-type branched-chain amino acid transport systems, periplasmic component